MAVDGVRRIVSRWRADQTLNSKVVAMEAAEIAASEDDVQYFILQAEGKFEETELTDLE
jgi:hypothetical protein